MNSLPDAGSAAATESSDRARAGLLASALAKSAPDLRIVSHDGHVTGPSDASTTVTFTTPAAFAQIFRAPRGLGLARAWVRGQIQIQGDWYSLIHSEAQLRKPALVFSFLATVLRAVPAIRLQHLRATGPTSIEYRARRPGLHTISGDASEIDFHYGLSTKFYRYLLGESLTYSCAIFADPEISLEAAQEAKFELICRKLDLDDTSVILDVGCGWGSFLSYAASRFSCEAIGLTLSRSQYAHVAGLAAESMNSHLQVRYGDYRQVLPLDNVTAVASIGMYEHVGANNSGDFFGLIRRSLRPGSRYLNQSIIMREAGPRKFRSNSFVQRYIFPNGQLLPLSRQLEDLRSAGFRVLSVDHYGQHYALTIRRWLGNLETSWDLCVTLEGEERVRAWYIYLMGAMARFERGDIDLVQVTAESR